MKTLLAKAAVAALGVSLAVAPVAANAAPWGVGVNVGGPGYSVHAGYVNPGGPRHWAPQPRYYHPYGWHPEGFYGVAPAGYYGYYWHGGWYHHRRWGNGIWIYF
ncbi:MAG: hypothetical protein ABSE64_04980 [Vulcanimicrobiaceae bacterium]|jgi:hypothetical protein